MNTAILSNEYQLLIPKEICETRGLKAGTNFEVISYNNRIELVQIKPIQKLKGILYGNLRTFTVIRSISSRLVFIIETVPIHCGLRIHTAHIVGYLNVILQLSISCRF